MKPAHLLLLALPLLIGSCVIHVHVSEPYDRDLRTFTGHPSYSDPVPGSKSISGIVVDQGGEPLRARVTLALKGGTYTTGTNDDGRFTFDDLGQDRYAVTAATKDARIAVVPEVRRGTEDLLIPVTREGATLKVEMQGRPKARLAIFLGEVRINDRGLSDGEPASFVVPAGHVDLLLYGDGLEERTELKLGPTTSHEVVFEVGS